MQQCIDDNERIDVPRRKDAPLAGRVTMRTEGPSKGIG
jgi:hypothetical protein